MTKKSTKSKRTKTQNYKAFQVAVDDQPKLIWFGWLVLIGPMAIVLFLSFFEGPPWIAELSKRGAIGEATEANNHGMKMLKLGRYREAHSYFNRALEIHPNYSNAYVNLGILFNIRKDYDEAIRYLNLALIHEDKTPELIYNNLAMAYEGLDDDEKALVNFEKALSAGIKTISVYRNIGALRMKMGDFEGAVEAYKSAIEQHPTIERSYDNMIIESLKKFDPKEAERDELYRTLFETIRNEYESGSMEVSFDEYDTLMVHNFLNSNSKLRNDYRHLATVYNKIGIQHGKNDDYKQASEAFEEAIKCDSSNENAKQNLEHCRQQLAGSGG